MVGGQRCSDVRAHRVADDQGLAPTEETKRRDHVSDVVVEAIVWRHGGLTSSVTSEIQRHDVEVVFQERRHAVPPVTVRGE